MLISKLNCPNKLKFLLWKCFHDRLPTRSFLHHIGINIDPICSFCKIHRETSKHIFLECMAVKQLWFLLGIDTGSWNNANSWLTSIRDQNVTLKSGIISWKDMFPFVIWTIWINRNNNLYNNFTQFRPPHCL